MALDVTTNDSTLFRNRQEHRIAVKKTIGKLTTTRTSRGFYSSKPHIFISASSRSKSYLKPSLPRLQFSRIFASILDKNIKRVNFKLEKSKENESLIFKSLFARIAKENARESNALLAFCAKIQSQFRGLSLFQFIILLISCAALFSPQFGGSRNLPVA